MAEQFLNIVPGDINNPGVRSFVNEHVREIAGVCPPETMYALSTEGFLEPEISLWTAWRDHEVVGCAALKTLSAQEGEIKTMRVAPDSRGQGIGTLLLDHLVSVGRQAGLTALLLETGSADFFQPARKLYEGYGFSYTGPFADYVEHPTSVFMKFCLDVT